MMTTRDNTAGLLVAGMAVLGSLWLCNMIDKSNARYYAQRRSQRPTLRPKLGPMICEPAHPYWAKRLGFIWNYKSN